MTENCSCGAAIKTWRIKWWLYWREHHNCNTQTEVVTSATEIDSMGFQPNETPEIENSVRRIKRGA